MICRATLTSSSRSRRIGSSWIGPPLTGSSLTGFSRASSVEPGRRSGEAAVRRLPPFCSPCSDVWSLSEGMLHLT
jgi:hypothetical protein